MKLKISPWKNKIRNKDDRVLAETFINLLNSIIDRYVKKKEYDAWNKKGTICTFEWFNFTIDINERYYLEIFKGSGKTPNTLRVRAHDRSGHSGQWGYFHRALFWGKPVFNNINLVEETCDFDVSAFKIMKEKFKAEKIKHIDVIYAINKYRIDEL